MRGKREERGFFGVGIHAPKTPANYGTLLRTAENFGASFVFAVGIRFPIQSSGLRKERHIPVFHFADCLAFNEGVPANAELVIVERADGAKELTDFVHPLRAVYILGPEDGSVPKEYLGLRNNTHVVVIPSLDSLNVSVAGGIVLADRVMKERRNEG